LPVVTLAFAVLATFAVEPFEHEIAIANPMTAVIKTKSFVIEILLKVVSAGNKILATGTVNGNR